MKFEVYADAEMVAQKAAEYIAAEARMAVAARGRFILAVSGGRTPWIMLRDLASEDVPWEKLQIVQVDERIAPKGDPDRNLTHLHESLLEQTPLTKNQIHAMPVNHADLECAVRDYAQTLQTIAGTPALIDLVHLGMGPDGHTASLIPNDPVLQVSDVDVALTGVYQNRRRMTLTYPIINRARMILWLVTGSDKVTMLPHLLSADVSIPAGRVSQEHAMLFADLAAYPHSTSK